MLHKYYLNGLHIVLDTNSGAVHIVDEAVFDILDHYSGNDDGHSLGRIIPALEVKYGEAVITEAFSEILELEAKGLLFSEEAPPPLHGKPVIKAMCLIVAQDCNMRCAYCFAGEGEYNSPGGRGMMSFETGKKAVGILIANSGNRKNLEIDFFGGEPLLNFSTVKQIVEYAENTAQEHGKAFRFTITTNGLLLNDESIDFINKKMYNVVLSLDGRKETNDRLRKKTGGQGSYDAAVPLIKKLVNLRGGKNYFVRGTFTRHNLDFSNDALHLAGLGFERVSIEPVVVSKGSSVEYALKESDLGRIFEEYENLAKIMAKCNKSEKAFNFFHFMIDLSGGPCLKKRVSGCGAGSEYMAVRADGTLFPCHQFASLEDNEKFKIGTVDGGISNKSLSAEFASLNIYSKKGCEGCFAKFYCGGGCPANAYASTGDLRGNDEFGCALQRKRTECALMLKCFNEHN